MDNNKEIHIITIKTIINLYPMARPPPNPNQNNYISPGGLQPYIPPPNPNTSPNL